jgi:hypothetical protein
MEAPVTVTSETRGRSHFTQGRRPMKKIMMAMVAIVCLIGLNSTVFADEMGKMKGEMGQMKDKMGDDMKSKKGDMKSQKDAMKGKMGDDMKSKQGEMKGKMGEMGK